MKKGFRMGIGASVALLGAVVALSLGDPIMAKAEGEETSLEASSEPASEQVEESSADEVSASQEVVSESAESEASKDYVQELEDKIASLEAEVKAKGEEFKKTETYSLIVMVIVIAAEVYKVIDKVSDHKLTKRLEELAKRGEGQITDNASALKAVKDTQEEVSKDYAKATDQLSLCMSALQQATEELKECHEENADLQAKVLELEDILLQIIKDDPGLVSSGTYKKAIAIMNGAKDDGE